MAEERDINAVIADVENRARSLGAGGEGGDYPSDNSVVDAARASSLATHLQGVHGEPAGVPSGHPTQEPTSEAPEQPSGEPGPEPLGGVRAEAVGRGIPEGMARSADEGELRAYLANLDRQAIGLDGGVPPWMTMPRAPNGQWQAPQSSSPLGNTFSAPGMPGVQPPARLDAAPPWNPTGTQPEQNPQQPSLEDLGLSEDIDPSVKGAFDKLQAGYQNSLAQMEQRFHNYFKQQQAAEAAAEAQARQQFIFGKVSVLSDEYRAELGQGPIVPGSPGAVKVQQLDAVLGQLEQVDQTSSYDELWDRACRIVFPGVHEKKSQREMSEKLQRKADQAISPPSNREMDGIDGQKLVPGTNMPERDMVQIRKMFAELNG